MGVGFEFATPEETAREGVAAWPIRLADGRDWGFAMPAVWLYPVFGPPAAEGGPPTVKTARGAGYREPVKSALEAFAASVEKDESTGHHSFDYDAFFGVAAALLAAAHDLDPGQVGALLTIAPADMPEFAAEVMRVITGEHGFGGAS